MALTPVQYAVIVATLGLVSFICGIMAELKKPPAGEVIPGKGVVICKYSSDPSIVLGYISTAFLAAASIAGYCSLFYPYKGKSIPQAAIFSSNWCISYLAVAFATSVFAAVFLIWPTVQGHLHHTKNVHTDPNFDCPTAKTGLLGGGAFASLNSSLFWLVSLMLVVNVREDYFDDTEKKELI
ncbi:hypothetical protein CDL12_28588 [Handroanthus impetiginosus]|uniref:Uncharacterized protein n=1 Tax=Handroanthus impetiginosus TaxID=429701 RepID=A0A2G9G1B7_9LAMI|nr:hypothetical protein CDL12_28588 [Handroanthus impetiginosus]